MSEEAIDAADTAEDHVGYESLMIACVTQAIEDYVDGPGDDATPSSGHAKKAHRRSRRKGYEEARHYVFDDTRESREGIFGFAFILLSLGIDPATARKEILQRTRSKRKNNQAVPLDAMYAFTENCAKDENA